MSWRHALLMVDHKLGESRQDWTKEKVAQLLERVEINVKGTNCNLNLATTFPAELIWSRIAEKNGLKIYLRTQNRLFKVKQV